MKLASFTLSKGINDLLAVVVIVVVAVITTTIQYGVIIITFVFVTLGEVTIKSTTTMRE